MCTETYELPTPWDRSCQKGFGYQGVMIFQVSLHAKGHIWIINKCSDCAGVLIYKYPD